jgi:hypothetical protein
MTSTNVDNPADQRTRIQHLCVATDLDFGSMFSLLEGNGFKGNYVNAFVSFEAMLKARRDMVEIARRAGVRVE